MSDLNHQRDIWVLLGSDATHAVITTFDWQAYKMRGGQGRFSKCNPYHPVTEAALPSAPSVKHVLMLIMMSDYAVI